MGRLWYLGPMCTVLIRKYNLQKCENRHNLCQSPFCRKDFPKGNFKYIPVGQKRNNGQSQVGVTSIESEEKKMTHIFYFIAFLILMIMLISKQMLNNETLRIPKW